MGQEWPTVIAIVGPTAVGKSALAMALAKELGAAIVSADSRQVYRYMDIGTAKPSRADQAEVEHFMLDLVQPDEQYSAQLFGEEGRRVLRCLARQGRPALVVGGTGFYVRTLLDGLAIPEVTPDLELRARLHEEAERSGAAALHHRLASLDPSSAERIHPNNLPRVIRALEIVTCLGQPVPALAPGDSIPALFLGLQMDRRQLWEIADLRVHAQIRAGLMEETQGLLAMGYSPDIPPLQGFAYRQMCQYVAGEISMAQAAEKYKTAQHQFIRRQMTWFRRDERIVWIEASCDVQRKALEYVDRWISQQQSGCTHREDVNI